MHETAANQLQLRMAAAAEKAFTAMESRLKNKFTAIVNANQTQLDARVTKLDNLLLATESERKKERKHVGLIDF